MLLFELLFIQVNSFPSNSIHYFDLNVVVLFTGTVIKQVKVYSSLLSFQSLPHPSDTPESTSSSQTSLERRSQSTCVVTVLKLSTTLPEISVSPYRSHFGWYHHPVKRLINLTILFDLLLYLLFNLSFVVVLVVVLFWVVELLLYVCQM